MVRRVSLTVMRHLPTVGNQKRQYIGWTDEPIVDVGASNWELPWRPKIVYGSDLLRAKQSATLYFPKAEYRSDRRFRESHFGDWEGKTYETLKENKTYRDWIDNPYTYTPPGGESLIEIEQRVLSVLLELPEDEMDHFIVTHGGPIRILLTCFSPEEKDFWSWHIPHGSAWHFEWEDADHFKEGKRCRSLSAVPITANETL